MICRRPRQSLEDEYTAKIDNQFSLEMTNSTMHHSHAQNFKDHLLNSLDHHHDSLSFTIFFIQEVTAVIRINWPVCRVITRVPRAFE